MYKFWNHIFYIFFAISFIVSCQNDIQRTKTRTRTRTEAIQLDEDDDDD